MSEWDKLWEVGYTWESRPEWLRQVKTEGDKLKNWGEEMFKEARELEAENYNLKEKADKRGNATYSFGCQGEIKLTPLLVKLQETQCKLEAVKQYSEKLSKVEVDPWFPESNRREISHEVAETLFKILEEKG